MSGLAFVVLVASGGFVAWLVIAAGVGFLFGRTHAVQPPTPPVPSREPEPAPEPQWGCDCCQDEAEEIAVLEAWWAA